MTALHKKVVGGAFGGLVAAGVAGSVAFACTAIPAVSLFALDGTNLSGTGIVTPEQDVTISVSTFKDTGPIDVTFNDMATSGAHVPITIYSAATGPSFAKVAVKIPAANLVRASNDPFALVATQFTDATKSTKALTAATMITVTGGTYVPPQAQAPNAFVVPSRPPAVASPVTTPNRVPAAASTPAPAVTPAGTPAARSGAAPAPAAPTVATAAPQSASPSAAPSNAALTTPAAAAEQTATSPAEAAPASAGSELLPATADLWSGLTPGTTPSLLDAPVAVTHGGGFPIGGALLGGGLLALAGTAFVTSRRRLAVSRTTR